MHMFNTNEDATLIGAVAQQNPYGKLPNREIYIHTERLCNTYKDDLERSLHYGQKNTDMLKLQ